MPDKPRLVLDTNVLLDWLLFKDPRAVPLARWIEAGQACWLSCSAMREEFSRVIRRDALAAWRRTDSHSEYLLSKFDRFAQIEPLPASASNLRCDDADDQVFVDLALASRPCALLSRDRAVLRLRRRAAQSGVLIATPEAWTAAFAA